MHHISYDNFIKEIRKKRNIINEGLLKKAFEFAQKAHEGQKRASGEPYFMHPVAVALTVASYGLDDDAIAAAVLHDVAEDTPVTDKEMLREFGHTIAFLVGGVTKLGKFKYRGEERKVENLRKMFLAMAEDIRVVLIKLADRLHNIETVAALPLDKRQRIARETIEIYAPIANRLGMGDLKGALEDISFPHAYPEQYEWLMNNIGEKYEYSKAYIKRITPRVKRELEQNNIHPASIQSRAKHYLSLYRKLERYDMNIDKIYDITAMRIIVSSLEECYAVLGILHSIFKPLPGKIKDYIASPKPNGYQSLHTTVIGYEGKITEFQIRTQEMHRHAEFGIAAHWSYSEAGKPKNGTFLNERKFSWVRQLQEWQHQFTQEAAVDSKEFLDNLRIDFFRERIFVFTPRGEVIDLPEGATPVDFAYQIHSEIGDHCVGAKVNGKMVSLEYALQNGDVVDIVTQKNKKPSTTTLGLAKTNYAKSKIRRFIKKTSPKTKKLYQMKVGVKHKVGMIHDITEEFAKEKINLSDIRTDTTDPKTGYIYVKFFSGDQHKVEMLTQKIKKLRHVTSCELREL